ncbi:unnamed protein product [Fusarium graminearum]|uniref:Uncharacterized protein n=1 Tax=Gibberella zeae TaxID=5518 RepID=A0A9N8RE44_GIBZA|nr:unnamed protein product [Fusarium graminearum]
MIQYGLLGAQLLPAYKEQQRSVLTCQHARPVPNTTDSTIPHQSSLYPPCYTDKKPNGPRSQGRD